MISMGAYPPLGRVTIHLRSHFEKSPKSPLPKGNFDGFSFYAKFKEIPNTKKRR
jgi:hypothetical protein